MKIDYEQLLSKVRDGVYFTDTARRITYWNQGAERITGFSATEVVGKRCADNILIHVDDRGRSLCKSLCPLARSLKGCVRPFDLVGRWGGDEFVCIARNVDGPVLEKMARRLLILLNRSVVAVDGSRVHIRASIGATMARNEDTGETLIQRADALMYASKQSGGNQITHG